jgi:hypothetical protein
VSLTEHLRGPVLRPFRDLDPPGATAFAETISAGRSELDVGAFVRRLSRDLGLNKRYA